MASQNPLLSEAIEEFIQSRQAAGIAKGTWSNEQSTLTNFLTAVGNIRVRSLEPRHVDVYKRATPHMSPNTRKTKIAHLSAFLTWLQRQRLYARDEDFLDGHRKIRVPKKRRPAVPLVKFSEFMDAATNERDRIILALGLFVMGRVGELRTLQWKHIDFDNQDVEIYRHKTGEWDLVPMYEELRAELYAWRLYVSRRMGVITPDPEWYVMCRMGNEHSRFGADDVDPTLKPDEPLLHPLRITKGALGRVGIVEAGTGMHTLRRSGARAMYDDALAAGRPDALEMVSAMLGHKDLSTTETYLDLDKRRKRRDEYVKGRSLGAVSRTEGGADVIELPRASRG